MAHQWRGVIREYFDRLDVDANTPIITLGEGGTPLVAAPALAKLVGAEEVYLKVEGMNPTGSFKDRGMTMAVSKAVGHGANAVHLVNSVNPDRIEGQKTGAFEVVEFLDRAPDIHVLPVGNAGNYSAYFKGYSEDREIGRINHIPQMWGYQADGSAPFVYGTPVKKPDTIATAIRIGNPASYELALKAREVSEGRFGAVKDPDILWMHRFLSQEVGVFVEPSSATGAAGLLQASRTGENLSGKTIVVTVTGNGLKDASWALKDERGREIKPQIVSNRAAEVADRLGLA